MATERLQLTNGDILPLCDIHAEARAAKLLRSLGETKKPCHDCKEGERRKLEVRAAVTDVLLHVVVVFTLADR